MLRRFASGCWITGTVFVQSKGPFLKNAQEVLEMLISSYLEDGQPIPEPQIIGIN